MNPLPMYGKAAGTDWRLWGAGTSGLLRYSGLRMVKSARARVPAPHSIYLFHLETNVAEAVLTFDLQDDGIAGF